MATENYDATADIGAILRMTYIAVVGLSPDPSRPSYGVAQYMQRNGYKIVPINPSVSEVLDVKAYAKLQDLPQSPEVVDVFRRSEFVGQVVDDAIESGARAIWLQSGIINYEAARRARKAGLLVVMDRCMMVEHARRR